MHGLQNYYLMTVSLSHFIILVAPALYSRYILSLKEALDRFYKVYLYTENHY